MNKRYNYMNNYCKNIKKNTIHLYQNNSYNNNNNYYQDYSNQQYYKIKNRNKLIIYNYNKISKINKNN